MRNICQEQEFGEASVAMPLKVTVTSMLDRGIDEARDIGAVNTIVLERPAMDNEAWKRTIEPSTFCLEIHSSSSSLSKAWSIIIP